MVVTTIGSEWKTLAICSQAGSLVRVERSQDEGLVWSTERGRIDNGGAAGSEEE